MSGSKESIYWQTNKEWYYVDEKGNYHLTEKATKRAIESFKLFMKPRSEIKNPFI